MAWICNQQIGLDMQPTIRCEGLNIGCSNKLIPLENEMTRDHHKQQLRESDMAPHATQREARLDAREEGSRACALRE
jgi:hypothetical protein